MSMSEGNFSWIVESEKGESEKGRSIGSKRPFPRREYKDAIKNFSFRKQRCRITIFDASSPRARDAAMHVKHEQTRQFGFEVHWHRLNESTAVGWTEVAHESDMRDSLIRMSYQDKQEKWAQEMLSMYGIKPAFWYKHNQKVEHERHITDSRPKSVLVRKKRV